MFRKAPYIPQRRLFGIFFAGVDKPYSSINTSSQNSVNEHRQNDSKNQHSTKYRHSRLEKLFFWTSAKQSLPLTGKSRFDENKDKKYGHDQSVKKDRKILSLMVWGAKTFSRPRTLIPVNDIVNNQKYSEILSDHLPGLISSFGHEQCIFDCDNFRAHTSRHTYQIVQENIRLTDWPAKSPVINIREPVESNKERCQDLPYRNQE